MAASIVLIIIGVLMFTIDIFMSWRWVNKKYVEHWELYLHGVLLSVFGALAFCLCLLGIIQIA